MSGKMYDDPDASARIMAMFSKADREELEALRADKKMREAAADNMALRELALSRMPADVRQFAERHRLSNYFELSWVNAFISGWRAHTVAREDCETPFKADVALPENEDGR